MHSVAPKFKKAVLYDTNSKRKNDIDKALTEDIAKDVQPYNIIENEHTYIIGHYNPSVIITT